MAATATGMHREVEFKFRVPENFDLGSILSGFSADSEPDRHMSATYFDTTQATLLRWGITMRYRTGGTDDGWHLKIPSFGEKTISGASVRNELHTHGSPHEIPAQFISTVAALLRDTEIGPLARVETSRSPHIVVKSGQPILEVVSDYVQVFQGETVIDSFHEVEVELLEPSGLSTAKKIVSALRASEATPSSVSKAAAAFGSIAKKQPDIPQLPRPTKSALPYDLVRWAISNQARAIIHAEVQSHLNDSSALLIRELESALKLLQALHAYLEPVETQSLREEITWLITELASPDQINADHTLAISALSAIVDPLDRHEAHVAIETYFDRRGISAQSSAIAAQRSDRYLHFFSDLMDFATVPPVTELAFAPQKLWRYIDHEDREFAAHVFHKIFPKKARKIAKLADTRTLRPSATIEVGDLFRRIALSGHTGPAGAYALGVAVGQLAHLEHTEPDNQGYRRS